MRLGTHYHDGRPRRTVPRFRAHHSTRHRSHDLAPGLSGARDRGVGEGGLGVPERHPGRAAAFACRVHVGACVVPCVT